MYSHYDDERPILPRSRALLSRHGYQPDSGGKASTDYGA